MRRYKRMSKAEFVQFMENEWGEYREIEGRISIQCPIACYLQTKFPDKDVAVGFTNFSVEHDTEDEQVYDLPVWAHAITHIISEYIYRDHVLELVNG